jgi:hypothetical protein
MGKVFLGYLLLATTVFMIVFILSVVLRPAEASAAALPAEQTLDTVRVKVMDSYAQVGQGLVVPIGIINAKNGLSGGTMTLQFPTAKLRFDTCAECSIAPTVTLSEDGKDSYVEFVFVDLTQVLEGKGDFVPIHLVFEVLKHGHPILKIIEVQRLDDDGGFPLGTNLRPGTAILLKGPQLE